MEMVSEISLFCEIDIALNPRSSIFSTRKLLQALVVHSLFILIIVPIEGPYGILATIS